MNWILHHPIWTGTTAAAVLALGIFAKILWNGAGGIINEDNMKDRDWEHFLDWQEDQRQKDIRRIGLKPR